MHPGTTRCLSAFAQRLPRVLLERCVGMAAREAPAAAFWGETSRGGVLRKGGSASCPARLESPQLSFSSTQGLTQRAWGGGNTERFRAVLSAVSSV